MTVASDQACRDCGAPLADDQRYCLNCGRRRGEPRLDYRRHMAAPGAATNGDVVAPEAPPASAVPAAEVQKPPRDFTPLAAVGGIAVLGLMLLVGVLIGRGDGNQAAPAPPQIVRVPGDEEGATASKKGGVANTGSAARKANSQGGGKDGALAGGSGEEPPAEITASESELEALQGKSPQEYSEAAAKLPDEIATPGKAPPTDDRKPGGGSSGTTIE